jgi:hypothetical protein
MGRRRREGNYTLQKKNSMEDLVGNEENSFSNVAGYKINLSVAFLYTNNEQIGKKI